MRTATETRKIRRRTTGVQVGYNQGDGLIRWASLKTRCACVFCDDDGQEQSGDRLFGPGNLTLATTNLALAGRSHICITCRNNFESLALYISCMTPTDRSPRAISTIFLPFLILLALFNNSIKVFRHVCILGLKLLIKILPPAYQAYAKIKIKINITPMDPAEYLVEKYYGYLSITKLCSFIVDFCIARRFPLALVSC